VETTESEEGEEMTQAAYDAGIAAFRQHIADEQEKYPAVQWRVSGRATKANPNKEDGAWWMREGTGFVHAYYAWRMNNPHLTIWRTPEDVPAIELEMGVDIGNDTKVKGTIDRVFTSSVDGERLIVDLKTGKPPSSGLQLAVYRLMLGRQFGDAPKYGAYWLAREGRIGEVYDLSVYADGMVERWMRDVHKAINMRVFVPNIGLLCDYCGVRRDCYAHGSTTYMPDFNNDIEEK
jgi:hypothetical protein